MKHFLLFYTLHANYMERRGAYRDEHLRLAWDAHERGELVLAGALHDPADTAVLLFTGEDGSAAEAFARTDPYVTNGLVERWDVRQWTTVIGEQAATPVRHNAEQSAGEAGAETRGAGRGENPAPR